MTTTKPLLSHQVAKNIDLPQGDWTERWFFKGNHIYDHLSNPICSVNECELKDVVDTLNKYGVHPKQTKPFVPGKPYTGDVNLPGPWGTDHVTSEAIYDENGVQIGVRNSTEMDHKLHPGVVERKIVIRDGFYHIFTEGGGYGSMGLPNVIADEWVWDGVDQLVIDNIKNSEKE